MTRSKPITIAALWLFLSNALSIVAGVPLLLTRGSDTLGPEFGTPPYFVFVVSLVLSSIGLVAAYGAWKNQRWGKILSIIVLVLNVLLALPGIFLAPTMNLQLFATSGIAINIVIIVLLLWRTPKPAMV